TTGGGGMIVTDDRDLARRAKHLTTTAKCPHPFEYVHDAIGFNYRMPNLNAALGCAQMEQLDEFIRVKRTIHDRYAHFFAERAVDLIGEIEHARSNYWLNAIVLDSRADRDLFLERSHSLGIMTRPVWQ